MTNLTELLKAPGASLECEDDFDAVNELMRGRGWGDPRLDADSVVRLFEEHATLLAAFPPTGSVRLYALDR